MIKGIGCDIVEIARIEKQIDEFGGKFLKRIYTQQEIDNAPENYQKKIAYFAKRFAGKEAAAKALGTGIGESIAFNEIEILNDYKGSPTLRISKFQDIQFHVSLSDEIEYAIAYVICAVNK